MDVRRALRALSARSAEDLLFGQRAPQKTHYVIFRSTLDLKAKVVCHAHARERPSGGRKVLPRGHVDAVADRMPTREVLAVFDDRLACVGMAHESIGLK